MGDEARAEELADFTIVCPHWGTEYRLTPDASQKKWVQFTGRGRNDRSGFYLNDEFMLDDEAETLDRLMKNSIK